MPILPYVLVDFNLRRAHFALKNHLEGRFSGESPCCMQRGGSYGG